ncbi:MAG: hypothetical protein ABSE56_19005 [Bryobacteraceae bacterium]
MRTGVLIAAICLCLQGQNTQSNDAQIDTKGLPPRATPADYQAQAQAGTVTVAAEFKGHSIPTLQGTLSTEDYVVIETGLFGSPGARIKLSADDFSLRINGKKTPSPAQPYGLVVASVKDPEWEPPEPAESKSKTRFGGGGKQEKGEGNEPPAPVKIPIGVQRAMAQRVQKASLPEGDRTLPQAGLIFFLYRGKTKSIQSIELIYAGPVGKATLTLQP